MKYQAFISYKQGSELEFSKAVGDALRSYAKPLFKVPVRVFRDEDHITPSSDLPLAIRQALADSEYLILLASPGAASSPWVKEELQIWCGELDRLDRLIIVVTEGVIATAPDTRTVDWDRTTALPRILREYLDSVPLYADLSWVGQSTDLDLANDRFKQTINSISARFRNIDPHEMSGVEVLQTRRNRRLRSVAIVALSVLTMFSIGAAFFADNQKKLAERRAEIASAINASTQSKLLLESQPDVAALLAARAYDHYPSPQTQDAMLYALTARPEVLGYLRRHVAQVNDLAVSPDGRMLASAGGDGPLVLWDAASGTIIEEVRAGPGAVTRVAFSPDSKLIAWTLENNLFLANANDPSDFEDLGTFGPLCYDLAFSPEGDRLVVASHELRVLDLASRTWMTVPGANKVTAFAFLSDSEVASVSVSDKKEGRGVIRFWSLTTGQKSREPIEDTEGTLGDIDASKDGSKIAVVTAGRLRSGVTVFSTENNSKILAGPDTLDFSSPLAVVFSHDDETVVAAGVDGTIRRWRVDDGTLAGSSWGGHASAVHALAPSPDGRVLFSSGRDGEIIAWSLMENSAVRTHVLTGTMDFGVAWDAESSLLAVSRYDGQVALWPVGSEREIRYFRAHDGPAYSAAIVSDDNRLITSGADEKMRLWDLDSLTPVGNAVDVKNGVINSLRLSSDAQWLVTIGNGGSGTLWRYGRGGLQVLPDGGFIRHTKGGIVGAALHPSRGELATMASDRRLRIWDLAARGLRDTIRAPHVWVDLDYSGDGNLLAAAGTDGPAFLISPGNPTNPAPRELHDGVSTAISVSFGTQQLVAVGTNEQTVQLWDTSGRMVGTPLTGLHSGVQDVEFSPDGLRLAAASVGGSAVWDVDPASWRNRLCRMAGRDFVGDEAQRYAPGLDRLKETCPPESWRSGPHRLLAPQVPMPDVQSAKVTLALLAQRSLTDMNRLPEPEPDPISFLSEVESSLRDDPLSVFDADKVMELGATACKIFGAGVTAAEQLEVLREILSVDEFPPEIVDSTVQYNRVVFASAGSHLCPQHADVSK